MLRRTKTSGKDLSPVDIRLLQALADGERMTILIKTGSFTCKLETLKKRMRGIRDLLGADTTIQAVAMAMRRKLII
ncbi:MAG: hypothetical protein ACRD20_02335 [Terriglobales bacterium]